MDNQTLTALERSIEKWKKNAQALSPADVNLGGIECPLCNLFIKRYAIDYGNRIRDNSSVYDCDGCPVFEVTGVRHCGDTPYTMAYKRHEVWAGEQCFDTAEDRRWQFVEAAEQEVDFLISLLPTQHSFVDNS